MSSAPALDDQGPLRHAAWTWAPFVAMTPGWLTYVASRPDLEAFLRSNAGTAPGIALLHMSAGAAVMIAVWMWIARHRRAAEPALAPNAALLSAVLSTRLVLLGPIVLALVWDPAAYLSMSRPALILAAALLVGLSVRGWPLVPERWPELARRVPDRAWFGLAVMTVVAIGAALVRRAFWRHHGFETRAFDLGIYDNLAWNTSHGDFLACSLIKGGVHTSAHFDPIMLPVSLVYALVPRAETLIVLQAVWVLLGVIPAYLIARRRLDDRLAAGLVGLALALYPAIHGILLHDFHSLALLGTPALWMIWSLDADRAVGYWVAFVLALMTREDSALFVVGVGIYGGLATSHRRRAALTIGLALAYLIVVKFAFMPDPGLLMENSDDAYAYANRYKRLIPDGGGSLDALATLVTNPAFVLGHVITRDKLASALLLLLPLGLFPLCSGRRLLMAGFGAAFMYLASQKSLFYPFNHYTTFLYPALIAATPEGIARVQRWLVERMGQLPETARAMVRGYLATCVILVGVSMGAVVGHSAYRPEREATGFGDGDRERYQWFVDVVVAAIPPDATVSASNRAAPHLSNRRALYILPQRVEADWVVAHEADIDNDDGKWVRSLVRERRYKIVARRPNEFRVLRRIDASE